MFIVHSYTMGVLLCVVTMICWGSWANTQKLAAKNWPFQLFYWDYVIGTFLIALIFAFTFGSLGVEGRGFTKDLIQCSSSSFISAFVGGIIFNLANILLVTAIDIAGLAVAFPVGIGIALVLGVVGNYIFVPIGNPFLLFIGVICVAAAIILDALAYKQLARQQGGCEKSAATKGLIIAVAAGILMGMFYRFVAASMSLDFVAPESGKLTPYTAYVIFAFGIVLSNVVWNTYIMKKPFSGEPVSYGDYFKRGTLRLHIAGILGGFIWGVGTLLSFISAGKAGFAISYGLGQGATMVAALWGVFVWKEFKTAAPDGCASKIHTFLAIMFLLYIIGLGLIITSRVV